METEAPGSGVSYKGSKRSSSQEKRICLISDNSGLRNTLCNLKSWVLCFSWFIRAEIRSLATNCWTKTECSSICHVLLVLSPNHCRLWPLPAHFFYLHGMRASGLKAVKTMAQSIFRDNTKERVQQGQIYTPHTLVLLVSITPWIRESCVNHWCCCSQHMEEYCFHMYVTIFECV